MKRKYITFREAIGTVVENMAKTELDLVTQIDDEVRKLYRHQDDPETISTSINVLAILHQGLGNWYVEAANDVRYLDNQYKYHIDKRKLELVKEDNSATVAESMARIEYKSKLDELTEAKHREMVIKIKREDTEEVIRTHQSRLATIRADIRQAP